MTCDEWKLDQNFAKFPNIMNMIMSENFSLANFVFSYFDSGWESLLKRLPATKIGILLKSVFELDQRAKRGLHSTAVF